MEFPWSIFTVQEHKVIALLVRLLSKKYFLSLNSDFIFKNNIPHENFFLPYAISFFKSVTNLYLEIR